MAKDLLDDGAITEEEFQIIKEKVMKKLQSRELGSID